MTYFNLRKRDPAPDTETAGADDEPVEAEAPDDETPDAPHGAAGALWAGISGPGQWLTARGRPGLAWLLYAGSTWAIWFYGGWIGVGVALAWLLAVLLFTPREFLDRLTAAIERRATPPPNPAAAPSPGGEREAVRRLLLDLIGEAHGLHLRTVLAHLQEHGQWEGRTVTDMRARLTLLGIPHDRNVKVAGVPTWGVRRADLDALPPTDETPPSPTPSPTV